MLTLHRQPAIAVLQLGAFRNFRLIVALVAFALGTVIWADSAAADTSGQEKPHAVQILREAMDSKNDRTVLNRCLEQIDREIASTPGFGLNYYARGWILSHLDKPDDAVAAYDRAFELDRTIADAPYNAGMILAGYGRDAEALKRWYAAADADPEHVDALYNAGQAHYNRKEYAKALDRWSKAQLLVPADFGVAKKVLQARNALGDRDAARKARTTVFDIWRTSKDPQVRQLTEYVFDQFDVGKLHVYAYETFEPSGDLYYVYTFRAAGTDDKVVGTVQLESSQVIRERGTPYIFGYTVKKIHHTTAITFKELPAYEVLKPQVMRLIDEQLVERPTLQPTPKSTPGAGRD